MLHLLIGERYYKKHKISNKDAFLKGCFAPDIIGSKPQTHFSNIIDFKTYTEALKSKVDLTKFKMSDWDLNNDYQKGEFLHIIIDYYFYANYLIHADGYQKYYDKDFGEVKDAIYQEYDILGYYIMSKYPKLNYNLLPESGKTIKKGKMKIFSRKGISKFVKFCEKLDLNQLYTNLKTRESLPDANF